MVVVREAPSSDPLVRYVVLSDVRFYLNRVHIKRKYNQPIPSATQRILSTTSTAPVETIQKAAQINFDPGSLVGGGSQSNGLRPFKADEILRDVAQTFTTAAAAHGFKPIPFSFQCRTRGNFVPNNVRIDALGGIALGQAMGVAGGVDVRVSEDGTGLEFVDAFMGAERMAVLAACDYALENMGTLRLIDMINCAPNVINVLFVRQVEFRADMWEQSPTGTQTAVALGNLPIFYNVGIVTDLSLTYDGNTYVQGTPVPMDTLLAAITAQNDKPAWTSNAVPFIRQTALDNYFNTLLDDNYVNDPQGAAFPSTIWQARVNMLRACLRRLYQLNPTFVARCVPGSIKAVRATIVDPVTSTRQNSPVYLDHCRRWLARGSNKEALHGGNNHFLPTLPDNPQVLPKGYVKNYGGESFPTNPVPLGELYQAPFEFNVLDSINGLMQIEPKKDPYGHIGETIPSLVTQIPTKNAFAVTQGGGFAYWDTAGLSYSHRIVTILTATPSGSNNEAQLHSYPVTAASAMQRLGVATTSVNAQGPMQDVRIQQTPALCARIAYNDTTRVANLACYTSPDGDKIASTLIPVNDADLRDYATASAAAVISAFLNHYEGKATVGFKPGVRPLGALQAVVHTVDGDGEFFTTLECRGAAVPVNPEHFLSASTRANLGNLGGSI